ncbi:MAG: cation-translocating P-type ATPase, partial [Alistipes sp.]|nr:cation-translocating P-type ATPase [Alistipes sp.]
TLAFYQSKAMRTLGFAYQWLDEEGADVVFVGVVGITDPIRDDVPEAIRTCKNRAGVRVIIVTGDTPGTANEIGRQIGLLDENEPQQTLTGPEFAAMSDEEALKVVADKNFKIISRARPDDKARLVMLLQRAGEVVAVTGDGTNDAPALSKAQVGLSMGDGTARAKEASDITIIDNSFASINKAIMWGRSLYKNIQRFIVFQMTINLCACMLVLLGAFIGLESPLTVTQMLWVNLIMDTFAAMALSSLPADQRVLDDKPRNSQSHILDRNMVGAILFVGSIFFLVLVAIWQQLHHIPGEMHSVDQMLSWESLKVALTGLFDFDGHKTLTDYERGVFFSIFVMMQFWNLFNVRFLHTDKSMVGEIINLFRNPKRFFASYSMGFFAIAALILVGQILIVNFAGPLFNAAPLSFVDWVQIILMTMPTLFVGLIFRNFGKKPRR